MVLFPYGKNTCIYRILIFHGTFLIRYFMRKAFYYKHWQLDSLTLATLQWHDEKPGFLQTIVSHLGKPTRLVGSSSISAASSKTWTFYQEKTRWSGHKTKTVVPSNNVNSAVLYSFKLLKTIGLGITLVVFILLGKHSNLSCSRLLQVARCTLRFWQSSGCFGWCSLCDIVYFSNAFLKVAYQLIW